MANIVLTWRNVYDDEDETADLRHALTSVRRPFTDENDYLSLTFHERENAFDGGPVGDEITIFGLTSTELVEIGKELQEQGEKFIAERRQKTTAY